MSARKRRTGPSLSSYIGLIRFYEEVEEQIKLNPYVILLIAALTTIIVLVARALAPLSS